MVGIWHSVKACGEAGSGVTFATIKKNEVEVSQNEYELLDLRGRQGIRVNQLRPFLNPQKCIQLLKEQLPGEEISEDGFDIDDYLYGEPFENLADVFTFCDDTDSLTYGDNGDGESYFYYPPSYPWERTENEPSSIAEVHERVIKAILRLCDMTREQVETLIDDDIYDYGCG